MSARRVIDWRIEPDGDDYTLFYKNKEIMSGRNLADIQRYLRRHYQDGQTVMHVAEDGYVTDMTRQVVRRHKRRPAPTAIPRPRMPVRMPLIRF